VAAAKLQALQRELDKANAEAEAAATRQKQCALGLSGQVAFKFGWHAALKFTELRLG
jgi:hypothetical protein